MKMNVKLFSTKDVLVANKEVDTKNSLLGDISTIFHLGVFYSFRRIDIDADTIEFVESTPPINFAAI